MKKIIYVILILVAIISIYLEHANKKYNYVSLTDELWINNRNYNNYLYEYLLKNNKLKNFNNYFYNNSIVKLTEDIKNNRTIKVKDNEYFLKKVLRESDIVVINNCMVKLIDNYSKYDFNKNYHYFNKLLTEIENLIIEVRKYAKGNIIFIGLYNPTNYYDSRTDELFYDMDIKLNVLMEKYSVEYIDLYEKVKNNQYKDRSNEYLLNSFGQKMISDIIEYYLE